jgi:hypothetical protein
VVGEAEVVVGAEAEDVAGLGAGAFAELHADAGVHGAFEGLEFFPDTILAELGEEGVGTTMEVGGGHGWVSRA